MLRSILMGSAAALLMATTALAQVADMPRNETLVLTPWGDQPAQFANVENWHPYLTSVTHQRDAMQITVNEMLFYTNLNTGELIPWQAESFELAPDFLSATIKLRAGVEWSDGQPFTADDVKFTLETLRDAPAEIGASSTFKEWVKDVTVTDPQNLTINFNKPAPRFVRDYLALGHENHYPTLPKHIWEGKDFLTFTNYDPAQGWPVGTGAYKLVLSTNQQEIFDRRDDWWGAKSGFQDLPAPKRITIVPVSSDDAMGQLHIANQIDGGRQLLIGTFEAARLQNDKLASWNAEGPNWGAPDGCDYSLVFNQQREPWNDVNLRYAINHAINRQQLNDIGYEGSQKPVTFAFSGYMAGTWLGEGSPLQAVLDKYNLDNPSQELVDEYMAKGGYAKDANGVWAKDGAPITVNVRTPAFIQPILAPLTQQLKNAGFDAVQAPVDDTWSTDIRSGNFDTMVFVHCGSLSEPFETLQHYHSKFSRPAGENIPVTVAASRYANPEYDAIIDRMEAVNADTDPNSEYMKDAVLALDMALRDLPQIDLLEEFHVVTFNNSYWTGWPSSADPYVAPYTPWEAFNMVIHNLQPSGAE